MNKRQANQYTHWNSYGATPYREYVPLQDTWNRVKAQNYAQAIEGSRDENKIPGEVSALHRTTQLADTFRQGLSEVWGAKGLAQGDPLDVAIGLTGAPGFIGTKIVKGALKAFPVLLEGSMLDDSLRYGWEGFKKALPIGGLAAISSTVPQEAQAGGFSKKILSLFDEIINAKSEGKRAPSSVSKLLESEKGREIKPHLDYLSQDYKDAALEAWYRSGENFDVLKEAVKLLPKRTK